jgi:hypothetical protein
VFLEEQQLLVDLKLPEGLQQLVVSEWGLLADMDMEAVEPMVV